MPLGQNIIYSTTGTSNKFEGPTGLSASTAPALAISYNRATGRIGTIGQTGTSATGDVITKLADGTPVWAAPAGGGGLVNLVTGVTGTLPIANGGTGLSTSGTADQVLTWFSGAPAWRSKTWTQEQSGGGFQLTDVTKIGFRNSLNAEAAIQIGDATTSAGTNHSSSIVIGHGIASAGNQSIMIGKNVSSTADNAVIIGHGITSTSGVNQVRIGASGTSGANAVSVGYNAQCQADGVAIGFGCISNAGGVAVGLVAVANETSVSVGDDAQSQADGVAVGSSSRSTGGGVSIGANATATTTATCVGNAANANTGTVSIGDAAGSSGLPVGEDCVNVGRNAVSSKNNSVAIGADSEAQGLQTIAIGKGSKTGTNATNTIAIGYLNKTPGGLRSTVIGSYSTALTTNTADDAVGIGFATNPGHTDAVCIGSGTVSNETGQICIGKNAGVAGTTKVNAIYVPPNIPTTSGPTHTLTYNTTTGEIGKYAKIPSVVLKQSLRTSNNTRLPITKGYDHNTAGIGDTIPLRASIVTGNTRLLLCIFSAFSTTNKVVIRVRVPFYCASNKLISAGLFEFSTPGALAMGWTEPGPSGHGIIVFEHEYTIGTLDTQQYEVYVWCQDATQVVIPTNEFPFSGQTYFGGIMNYSITVDEYQ